MQELANKASVRIGEHDPLLVLRYAGTPTMASAQVLEDVLWKRLDADPKKQWVFLLVIDAAHPVPDKPVQARLAEVMKSRASQVAALGNVVIGSGFQAAAVRFALLAISMLSRPGYPIKVFSTFAEAITWLPEAAPKLLSARDAQALRPEVERFQG